MTTAAKAFRRAAEGKAFAQAEAAAWKGKFELEKARNMKLERKALTSENHSPDSTNLHLKDLNLTSCTNLHPERIVLQCPNLETIQAAKCVKTLHEVLDTQVNDCAADINILSKRMADGSKRVRVPYTPFQLPSDDSRQFEPRKRRCIVSTR